MVEDAMDTRVVKVTLERADGEIDTRVIGNNDGVVCLVFSKSRTSSFQLGTVKIWRLKQQYWLSL